jgi:hypothetical protein
LRRLAAVVVLATTLAACGAGNATLRGVVIDVSGDITTVQDFTLRLPDGTDQRLVPAPGITFHGGAAIGHLRDHLRSGQEIVIEYEVLDDGTWVAVSVEDA